MGEIDVKTRDMRDDGDGSGIGTTIWDEARNNGHNQEEVLRGSVCVVLDITSRSRRWEQEGPNGRGSESVLAWDRNTG